MDFPDFSRISIQNPDFWKKKWRGTLTKKKNSPNFGQIPIEFYEKHVFWSKKNRFLAKIFKNFLIFHDFSRFFMIFPDLPCFQCKIQISEKKVKGDPYQNFFFSEFWPNSDRILWKTCFLIKFFFDFWQKKLKIFWFFMIFMIFQVSKSLSL